MASLKEVKNRITSVTSTRKITSAMKLVASSKLHKAQGAIESMLPYSRCMDSIMSRFVDEMSGELSSPYIEKRSASHAVIVAISSNSSLCGAFNSNVVKEVEATVKSLRQEGIETIEVVPVGAKIAEKVRKMGFSIDGNNAMMLDRPAYGSSSALAASLMERYAAKEIDRVILIYNHFKNAATQVMTNRTFLPLDLDQMKPASSADLSMALDYIVEPSAEEIVHDLLPKVLYLQIYTAVLDSLASEHAARVVAMQVATDNADELLGELTLMYNKQRQAAITAELLDIVGASFQ